MPAGKIISFLLALALLFGCSDDNTFTDERDGKKYKTVKKGEQVWMAENLNYEAEGSKCYDNMPKNCKKYGRLYDWETALKACPNGWHLPSLEERENLVDYADFVGVNGGIGFSDGNFDDIEGHWWNATEYDVSTAYYWNVYGSKQALRGKTIKTCLFSVRCLRD